MDAVSTKRRLTVQTQESFTYDPERVQALYDVLAPDPDLYGDEPVFALYLYLNGLACAGAGARSRRKDAGLMRSVTVVRRDGAAQGSRLWRAHVG